MQTDNHQEDVERGYSTKDTICQLFGLSSRRIEQLVADGVITRTKTKAGVRFETVQTIQKYVKYLSDKAYGKDRSEAEAKLKEQKLKADIALKESQGELHKLRTDIAAGRYISVEEVKLDYSRFFVQFKKFALSLPSRLAGRLTGFIDPVEVRRLEKDLAGEVTGLLEGFVTSAVVEDNAENREAKQIRFSTIKPEEPPKKVGRPKKNAAKKE